VSISVLGDRTAEPNEAFTVNLSAPQGVSVRRSKGTVSLLTDDRPGTPTGTRVSVGAASIVEGNLGARALRFTVALSSPTSSTVKVHYATSPGSATSADFGAVSGDLTIPAGATTALVAVRVKPDTTAEPMEQFTLTLSASTGAPIDRATAAGSILDDD
jgi:chitinase